MLDRAISESRRREHGGGLAQLASGYAVMHARAWRRGAPPRLLQCCPRRRHRQRGERQPGRGWGPRHQHSSAHTEALGVALLEGEAETGSRQVGRDRTVMWNRRTIEQHLLNPDMIVKPFKMPQSRRSAGGVQMQRGSAVAG